MMMRRTWTLALAATLMLAGCGREPDHENTDDTNVVNAIEEAPVDTAPFNDVQAPSNAAVEPRASPPDISDEQQIQDDADAAGMTSRLPDESAPPSPPPSAPEEHSPEQHVPENAAIPN